MAMSTPSFTAEASLYRSVHQYRTARDNSHTSSIVHPMQGRGLDLFPFDCGGTTDDCIALNCRFLTGKDRAKCIATCNQPSSCEPCNCTCAPNCARTCTRRCCRTSEGPPYERICCVGDCFRLPFASGGV